MASILNTLFFVRFISEYCKKYNFTCLMMQESVAEYIAGPSNIFAPEYKMHSDDFTPERDMAVSHDWAVGCALYHALCTVHTNTAL